MDKPLNKAIEQIEQNYQDLFDKSIYQGLIKATKNLLNDTITSTDQRDTTSVELADLDIHIENSRGSIPTA
jgi:hypothetical protein